MSKTFAEVVEAVKQLSLTEKEALLEILNKDPIQGKQQETLGDHRTRQRRTTKWHTSALLTSRSSER